MKRPFEKLAALALLAALILAAHAATGLWGFTSDDTFITLRYSRNLARGLGPTFNAAPPRAEGYTSFLWMLLTALGHIGSADPLAVAKAMGVALSLLTAAACGALAWRLCEGGERGSRTLAAGLAAALFTAYPLTPVHAVSGMDTALAGLAFALLVLAAVRPEAVPSPILPCCALLAGLTRPEFNLAAGLLLAIRLAGAARVARRRFILYALAFYIVPGAAYFAWRAVYYGALLPLPFYVKAAGLIPLGLYPGLHFVLEVAAAFGPLLALALVNLTARGATALGAVAIMVLYLLLPQHLMGYGHRYFQPLVPVLAAVSARGALLILAAVRERLGAAKAAAAYAALAILALGATVPRHEAADRNFAQYATGLRNAHVRLGKLLGRYGQQDMENPILAIADAGAVPYYSGWETVDTFGLNDPHIARTGDHSPAYVFSRRPTVVVLISVRRAVFQAQLPWEQALYAECLRRGLAPAAVLEFAPAYHLWVMAPPDGPLSRHVSSGLRPAQPLGP